MHRKLSSIFPPPDEADEEGLVALSRDVRWEMLADAYSHGIFPWPFGESASYIPWVSPPQRGVIFMDEFHIPSSLQRELKKTKFILRIDHDFEAVITGCAAAVRPDQVGTWITGAMIREYCQFHKQGYAHSFEAYDENGMLAGGLYGVSVGRIFCGESMFYRVSGASKFAFVKMFEVLHRHGVKLIDTQMVTPLTAAFGAREIPRKKYLELLSEYGGEPLKFK